MWDSFIAQNATVVVVPRMNPGMALTNVILVLISGKWHDILIPWWTCGSPGIGQKVFLWRATRRSLSPKTLLKTSNLSLSEPTRPGLWSFLWSFSCRSLFISRLPRCDHEPFLLLSFISFHGFETSQIEALLLQGTDLGRYALFKAGNR